MRVKILVAASGGEGHLGPLIPFVEAALEARDRVLLVVPPSQEESARATGAEYRVTAAPSPEDVAVARRGLESADPEMRARAAEVELFGRINTAAALQVTSSATKEFDPDLILREPCDYASAIVARRRNTAMATVGISPGLADISGLRMAGAVIEHQAPGVTTAIAAAPYLTRFPIVENEATGYPDTRRYGFPTSVGERREERPPLVWLTMGTVNTGFDQTRGTWDAAVAALSELDVRVLASTGRGGVTLTPNDRLDVVEWVDLSDILGRASAVVCHGGSGTTLAALAAGVPVVTIPMIADQPTNAAMVERLGAGITVAPRVGETIGGLTSADVPRLRKAVADVVQNTSYHQAARHAATLFASAPTVHARLDELRTGSQDR